MKKCADRWIELLNKIREMIQMRMKIEDTENEVDHVKNKNDPDYFNKPLQFSRDFFVFYV